MVAGQELGDTDDVAEPGLSLLRSGPRPTQKGSRGSAHGVAGSGGSWEPGSVDGDDCGAGPPTDLGGRAGGLEGVTHYVHPAAEVEDNMPRFDSVNG